MEEGFRKVPCGHGRESARAMWTAAPVSLAGRWRGVLPEGPGHCRAAGSLDALCSGAPLTLAAGTTGQEMSFLPSSK